MIEEQVEISYVAQEFKTVSVHDVLTAINKITDNGITVIYKYTKHFHLSLFCYLGQWEIICH